MLTAQSNKSIDEIQKQAKLGDAHAQFLLGSLYDTGELIPKDLKKALMWYKKAANQGHAKAQFNLGRLYANGKGVQKDYVKAYSWFNLAAANGNADAADYRNRIGKVMTKQQIAKGQELSKEINILGKSSNEES